MEILPGNSQFFNDVRDELMEFYKNGWLIERPIYADSPAGSCFWICPFISTGTPVQVNENSSARIEAIRTGETILMAGKSLDWEAKNVVYNDGSSKISKYLSVILVTYSNTALAVSADHIFRLHNGSLITAERLSPQHQLTSANGEAVTIRSVHVGEYAAGFRHIEIQRVLQNPDWSQCFLLTNGIVSGDYSLQLFFRDGILGKDLVDGFNELPVIGSGKYIKMHGDNCLRAPEGDTGFIKIMDKMPKTLIGNVFVPAIYTFEEVPPDAASFISEADQLELFDTSLRPLSDPNPEEWVRKLKAEYEAIYSPGIDFECELHNPNVNARAWMDAKGMHVLVWGGLIRYGKINYEGIALVMGHETGHLVGRTGRQLACEGESDYIGVKEVMLNVFATRHYAVTTEGIRQIAKFFTVPNSPTIPTVKPANCRHPDSKCRIATYYEALSLRPKPSCAN
jgi:hypothetical protein